MFLLKRYCGQHPVETGHVLFNTPTWGRRRNLLDENVSSFSASFLLLLDDPG